MNLGKGIRGSVKIALTFFTQVPVLKFVYFNKKQGAAKSSANRAMRNMFCHFEMTTIRKGK